MPAEDGSIAQATDVISGILSGAREEAASPEPDTSPAEQPRQQDVAETPDVDLGDEEQEEEQEGQKGQQAAFRASSSHCGVAILYGDEAGPDSPRSSGRRGLRPGSPNESSSFRR